MILSTRGDAPANVDYGVTADFAKPAGPRERLWSSDPYFLKRQYYGAEGANGGIVVVNGNSGSNQHRWFYMPWDAVGQDANGQWTVPYSYNDLVLLPPNTGRLFRHLTNYKYASWITEPQEDSIIQTSNYTIRGKVIANRESLSLPSIVQVKIDDGNWHDCPVDSNGNFSYEWSGYTEGKHTIYTRAYVNANDYEPDKRGRDVEYSSPALRQSKH